MPQARTGRVERHGNKWRYQVIVDGIRYRRSFDTQREARHALDELLGSLARDYRAELAATVGPLTVGQLVGDYLDRRRPDLEPSTMARYDNVVAKYILPGIGRHEARRLADTPYLLESFVHQIPWGSARKALEVLNPAFRSAADNGLIARNPVDAIRRPRPPKRRRRKEIPTPEEVEKIVGAAYEVSPSWGLFVDLTAQLGTRRSETCAFRVEDFEPPAHGASHGWVHVQRAVGKAAGTYIKLPKSGLERDLLMPKSFFEIVEPWLDGRTGWLFPGRSVRPRRRPDELTHDSSAGRLILWLLEQGGEVACSSGRAGAAARTAIGVNSSTLSQVTAALVASGHLSKECNARRTFALGLTSLGLQAAEQLRSQPCDGGRPIHPDTADHRFQEMMRRIGVAAPSGNPFGLHSLRHFVATHLYNRTHDWVQVARFLGHTSPIVTMELYSNNVVELTQALLGDVATTLYRRDILV